MQNNIIKNHNRGIAAILLALFLPLLVASVYFGINFSDKSSHYVQKNCSADAVLAAIKNYNFAVSFENQKLGLLSYADTVYNDWSIKSKAFPITLETDTITFYKFYATPNKSEYNQFLALYYAIDGCHKNDIFYKNNSFMQYIANKLKVANVAIPNDKLNQYSYAWLPINASKTAYHESIENKKSITFNINKTNESLTQVVTYNKRKTNSNILTISKDPKADKLTVKITEPQSGEIYESSAVPAKCNVDIIFCIPTNGASCNALNLDAASISGGEPLCTSSTSILPDNTSSTPIYQITQACKNFLLENFMSTQGICVGLIPYSGKISIPHYYAYNGFAIDQYVFNLKHCSNTSDLVNTAYGYELYGLCGDPKLKLDSYSYGTASATESMLHNSLDKCYKYGFPIMYQRGPMKNNGKGFYYHNSIIDISKIISSNSDDSSFFIANMYPSYLGYTNLLSLKSETGVSNYPTSIDYQPNPYYIIMLTPDIIKVCDLLECFRPINDKYNVSNFCFLPLFFSNYLLNYQATGNNTRNTSENYFSQESKLTSGRNKVVILFVNKPDHFEPGELTFLGFSNDNNQFYFGESDAIKFNADYSSSSYKFVDGSLLKSISVTTRGNVDLYGSKKILRFKQTEGTLSKTESTAYYWNVPDDQIAKASLKFPAKHLIKLVFEGDYKDKTSVTFYSDNGVQSCKNNKTGEEITLDSPYTINEETEFVFSGSTLSEITSSGAFNGLIFYGGKNFKANMSPYKVKYDLVNTEISSAVLKDQILRFNWTGTNRCDDEDLLETIILKDGRKFEKPLDLTEMGYKPNEAYPITDNILKNKIELFNDYCCKTIMTSGSINMKISETPQDNHWYISSSDILDLTAYGIEKGKWYASVYCGYASKVLSVGVLTSTGYYDPTLSYYWNWLHVLTAEINSQYSDRTLLKIKGIDNRGQTPFYSIYLKNSNEKTLFSQTITNDSNIVEPHMAKNEYIDLFKLTEKVNDISPGNWICFQGDGELHVTVKPQLTIPSKYLSIENLKNNSSVTINDISSPTFPNRKIVYIEPESIPDDLDDDGDYHLDLEMKGITLVSAEITNRTYIKTEPTATYSLEKLIKNNDVETITDSKTETITKTITGDTIRTYTVISNDRRPINIFITPSESIKESIKTEKKSSVTFYSENGVQSCKNNKTGEEITLDSPYIINEETEFVFSGSTLSEITSSGAFNGLIFYGGENFKANMSPYKVKYDLVNTEISSAVLKDQVLRFNWTGINRCNDEDLLETMILSTGEKLKKPLNLIGLGYTPKDPYSITDSMLPNLQLFNDNCCITTLTSGAINMKISETPQDNHWYISSSDTLDLTAYGIEKGKWYASVYCGYASQVIKIGVLMKTMGYYYPVLSYYWNFLHVLKAEISSKYSDRTLLKIKGVEDKGQTPFYAIYLKNSNEKTLSSQVIDGTNMLDSYMPKNEYIFLFKLKNKIYDISPGNWICFQGDGELHVTVKPQLMAPPSTATSLYWSTSASYEQKNIYTANNRNFPYEFYNDSNGKENYIAINKNQSSNVQTFRLDPHRAIHSRDENGNFVYTITVKNAIISDVEVVDKDENSFIFPNQNTPVNNQPIDLYKQKSYDTNLSSIFSFNYFIERLYPYISYGANSSYSIKGSYGPIYTKKYHADGTLFLNGFTEWPNYIYIYSNYIPNYSGNKNNKMYIPSFTRIFSPLRRSTSETSYRSFYLDDRENSRLPYQGWAEICGIHYTMPDNYALTKYLENYPEDTPSDKYNQESILQKIAVRCANNLKQSGNIKIYIIKYRKQSQYKTIPLYSGGEISMEYNYDYLDQCASGKDYIYDCNSENELNEIMKKIANEIKETASYEDAHCI